MFTEMFKTFFPSTKKENKTMANSTQYVVYTRNFKSRAKQIGVFAEPASSFKVNGEVHGGKIKFKNLAVKNTKRKTATNKLLSKGLDFTVEILGVAPQASALTMKSNIISKQENICQNLQLLIGWKLSEITSHGQWNGKASV